MSDRDGKSDTAWWGSKKAAIGMLIAVAVASALAITFIVLWSQEQNSGNSGATTYDPNGGKTESLWLDIFPDQEQHIAFSTGSVGSRLALMTPGMDALAGQSVSSIATAAATDGAAAVQLSRGPLGTNGQALAYSRSTSSAVCCARSAYDSATATWRYFAYEYSDAATISTVSFLEAVVDATTGAATFPTAATQLFTTSAIDILVPSVESSPSTLFVLDSRHLVALVNGATGARLVMIREDHSTGWGVSDIYTPSASILNYDVIRRGDTIMVACSTTATSISIASSDSGETWGSTIVITANPSASCELLWIESSQQASVLLSNSTTVQSFTMTGTFPSGTWATGPSHDIGSARPFLSAFTQETNLLTLVVSSSVEPSTIHLISLTFDGSGSFTPVKSSDINIAALAPAVADVSAVLTKLNNIFISPVPSAGGGRSTICVSFEQNHIGNVTTGALMAPGYLIVDADTFDTSTPSITTLFPSNANGDALMTSCFIDMKPDVEGATAQASGVQLFWELDSTTGVYSNLFASFIRLNQRVEVTRQIGSCVAK